MQGAANEGLVLASCCSCACIGSWYSEITIVRVGCGLRDLDVMQFILIKTLITMTAPIQKTSRELAACHKVHIQPPALENIAAV